MQTTVSRLWRCASPGVALHLRVALRESGRVQEAARAAEATARRAESGAEAQLQAAQVGDSAGQDWER